MSDLFDRAQGEVNCSKDLSPTAEPLDRSAAVRSKILQKLQDEVEKAVLNQLEGEKEEQKYTKDQEKKVEDEVSLKSGPASPAELQKFPVMTLGSSVEATKGLKTFIGLSDDKTLSQLLEQGIGAMQDEVIEHGSLQDLENFFYVCYGVAQHEGHMPAHVLHDIERGKYHGGKIDPGEYDKGNEGKRLFDFVHHQHSQDSKISECNALAARLYTTSSYKRFNVPLRKHEDDIPHPVPHPFKMTVYYLDEGLRASMRTIAAQENPKKFSQDRRLYRGMKGMIIDTEELEGGGIDRAPMSTTVQRRTAASYAGALPDKDNNRALETGPRTIIEFVTEGLSTGTSIEFLSVYPTKDAEYLYPPLTRIKLDNHVIISQERFESLLDSETDDTGLFAKAEKQHEDVQDGIMICKMSVQIC